MEKINVTEQQLIRCKAYQKNLIGPDKMHILFKTYLQEYINIFSWNSWKNDPIETILNNFCNAATCKG